MYRVVVIRSLTSISWSTSGGKSGGDCRALAAAKSERACRPSPNQWKSLVLMERWRRWQRPFKSGCTCAPRVGGGRSLLDKGIGNPSEKRDQPCGRNV